MELQTLAPPQPSTGAINKIKTTTTTNGSNNKVSEIKEKSSSAKSKRLKMDDRRNTNLEINVEELDMEDECGEDEQKKEPRISCCYGLMVFVGLALSLLGLTLLVIYAGFWSNYAMQGKTFGNLINPNLRYLISQSI